ncbi:hypothetical protein AB1K83_02200 [Sporosarcina sp. 179-K 3D1 HS]|uniref:hypothetical protein n=1 Tax=Sporosarcina sp. 179-K 3D1 HS TaxID=3232169 RepID=UPI0039A0BD34
MDIWSIPMAIVVLIITMITIRAVRKWQSVDPVVKGHDSSIPEAIEEHPFGLNPIIWVILVVTIFIGIVIFYYAFTSSF